MTDLYRPVDEQMMRLAPYFQCQTVRKGTQIGVEEGLFFEIKRRVVGDALDLRGRTPH
ncbi:hypothetical protein GGQ82_000674 [Sphingobium olei]